MIPEVLRIQAIRGFQQEQAVPLSTSLTVIYGENGRGKTSLCEGWNWLFTGQMLVGLEPQSELGSAGKNIHVDDLPLSVRLFDADDNVLISRIEDQYQNPGNLPDTTSPVLLQYRLNQVLFSSQGDRRQFFEMVMELDVEASFAQSLRRACLSIDPVSHGAWGAWQRAIKPIQEHGFNPPHPKPIITQEQKANESALIEHIAEFLGAPPTLKGIEEVLETGSEHEIHIGSLYSPISEEQGQVIEEAISCIEGLNAEADQALQRATWQESGFNFIHPPKCPFCNEETLEKGKIEEIRQDIRGVRERHRAHNNAVTRFKAGVSVVMPLVELDIEATRSHLQQLKVQVPKLELDEAAEIGCVISKLDDLLLSMQKNLPVNDIGEPEKFRIFASSAIGVTKAWLELSPYIEDIEVSLKARRIRNQYLEAATSIRQYYRENLNEFYRHLEAQPVFLEISEAAPKVIDRLKQERLNRLSTDIVKYYRILRPDDPTSLEEIVAASGIRGDIRIMARSGDKVDHASALFSHSNSNALGMACHIARVIDGGHQIIVLDDPFQSLDDSNREYAVRNLIESLLDVDLQVVVLTHERDTAIKILDCYVERGALGTALRWDKDRGAIPEPMYPNGVAQVQVILDGLETDSQSEVLKICNALRQLIEGFCADYLREVGGDMPPSYRRNMGSYIDCLEKLSADVRPNQQTLTNLNDWNEMLSTEAHFDGTVIEGMNKLKAIAREVLEARIQEKQLRPPGLTKWKGVPESQGVKERVKRILNI